LGRRASPVAEFGVVLVIKKRIVRRLGASRQRADGARDVGWIIIHWFELSTLVLLCLNLWFISTVLNALRETNHWLAFLSGIQWDETRTPHPPKDS
jgi:hypothetical protein